MAKFAKRVAMIGLDCCEPHLVKKHVEEGYLPNLKKIMDTGFWTNDCLVPLPTITPPNWATISTGAYPGTHGVTCFHHHRPGTSPENANTGQSWSSELVQVETIWEAADKAGLKTVVLTFPGAWPSRIQNGIVIGGNGMVPGESRHDLPHADIKYDVCQDFVVSTEFLPFSARGKFDDAEDWANLDEEGDDPIEMEFQVPFVDTFSDPKETRWWILVRNLGGQGYDTVTLSPTKDFSQAFCTLKKGEWSGKIFTDIEMKDGSKREVFFKCKPFVLSEDAEEFRMAVGCMCPTDGAFTTHPELFGKIARHGTGSVHRAGGMYLYARRAIDLETYLEMAEDLSEFLGDACEVLLPDNDWSVFAMHSHPIDWLYHALITEMSSEDPEIRKMAWDAHLRIYQSEDRLVGRIMNVCDKHTLISVVSDHGAVPDGPTFDPYKPLVGCGLTHITEAKEEDQLKGEMAEYFRRVLNIIPNRVDFSKSVCCPQRETYVYINLKGRDPEGIVEPEDYHDVQQRIIDCLLAYVDPDTGKRPVALAIRKEDARLIGLYGDRVGDVVYAIYPEFGAQHGAILPTAAHSVGKLNGLMAFCGPGIKKGQVLDRPCHLVDYVPTLCYAAGLPIPNGAEGAVLYNAFVDPDGPFSEIKKLNRSLENMEEALAKQTKEPWDKHDCA